MRFLPKKVFSLNTIIVLHIIASLAVIFVWTVSKRGGDFSVTSFPDESFYISGGSGEFNLLAIVIGALFKYLHFNHFAFYLFSILLSTTTVVVFFKLARTFLNKKLSLYLTAIFAFNPLLIYFNNFVLKENLLVLVIIVVMYFFFKALATNLLGYKILFCLLLPFIPLIREPLVIVGLLPLVLLSKSQRNVVFLAGIVGIFSLLCLIPDQCEIFFESLLNYSIGTHGAAKIVLENIHGTPTCITFRTLFSSPRLMMRYLSQSFLYYITPGWHTGILLNSVLVPYTSFIVYVFIASFRYRKFLTSIERTAYSFIALIIILISLILIIYDPNVRYRYSVFQLALMLIVLNFKAYQMVVLPVIENKHQNRENLPTVARAVVSQS